MEIAPFITLIFSVIISAENSNKASKVSSVSVSVFSFLVEKKSPSLRWALI